jgi:DNA-binding MarR family transcriptional regulator
MKRQRSGGFLISKIHRLSGRIFTKLLKEYNIKEINRAQGRIMFPLWKEDGISIAELSQKTALSKTSLTSMLDRLEKAGHIKRVHSKEDRRKVLIYLTEKNIALAEKYSEVSKEMTKLYYEGFNSEEIDEFEKYLERILDNLQKNIRK